MSEKAKTTASTKRILLLHDTEELRQTANKIGKLHCDERCVLRFASLVAMCGALAAAGLGYVAILGDNISFGTSDAIRAVLRPLVLTSLICVPILLGQLVAYRRKLNRFEQKSRQLTISLDALTVDGPQHPHTQGHVTADPQGRKEPKPSAAGSDSPPQRLPQHG